MAARIQPTLAHEWRAKIQTSMLINRLNDFAFNKVEMSSDQVRAALGLLKKTLPDLSQQAITDSDGNPLPPFNVYLTPPK